jgi:hypothetical protein
MKYPREHLRGQQTCYGSEPTMASQHTAFARTSARTPARACETFPPAVISSGQTSSRLCPTTTD